MALIPGNVVVNPDGSHSGSGAALYVFEAAYADFCNDFGTPASPELMAGVKRGLAGVAKFFGHYSVALVADVELDVPNNKIQ